MILLTWFLSLWQLLFRINIEVHVILLFIAAIYTFINWQDFLQWVKYLGLRSWKAYWLPGTIFLIFTFFVLLLVISPIIHSDTGLYHAQTVRWFEDYRIIPGLGNLHERFAYNNSWFVLSAFFSLSFLGIQPFYVLNGFIILVFGSYCLWLLFNGEHHKSLLVTTCAVFLPILPIVTLEFSIASLSPDLPNAIFVWLVFLFFIQKHTNSKPFALDTMTDLVALYSLYAITLKLSSAPILLAPLILLAGGASHRRLRPLLVSAILAVTILIPWFVRSYFLSGYLIYPYPAINIFSPDWKIPLDLVKQEGVIIQNWSV